MTTRRRLLAGAAALAARPARAAGPLRIGVLAGLAGPFALGLGAIAAARIAAEEVGHGAVGRAIEVLSADAGDDPAFGATIVRGWVSDGVEAVACVSDDAVALAVQAVCRDAGRVVLFCGATATALTGTACSPTGFQWLADARSLAHAMVAAFSGAGGRSARVVAGGRDELAGALGPELARAGIAQGEGGVLVCGDAARAVPAGLRRAGPPIVVAAQLPLGMVAAEGLATMAGALVVLPFYWDGGETGRFWARRFMARTSRMPEAEHIGVYEAVRQYLRVVAELGRSDGAVVARQMRFTPVESAFSRGVRISADGRVQRPLLVARVKAAMDSRGPWDFFEIVASVPAEGMADAACPLVKSAG